MITASPCAHMRASDFEEEIVHVDIALMQLMDMADEIASGDPENPPFNEEMWRLVSNIAREEMYFAPAPGEMSRRRALRDTRPRVAEHNSVCTCNVCATVHRCQSRGLTEWVRSLELRGEHRNAERALRVHARTRWIAERRLETYRATIY